MLLAKKYGENTISLKVHLEKNLWAAESLVSHELVKERIKEISNLSKSIIISSVFHDLGKANKAFQSKLYDQSIKKELLTHDAISFMFLFEVYLKNRDKKELLLAAYASLKHHNRSLFIEQLPSTERGIKSAIDVCFNDIKKYKEQDSFNLKIDDSNWIRRSHINGMGEVSRLEIVPSVVDVYRELGFEEYCDDLEDFIKKTNEETKAQSVERFIKHLGTLMSLNRVEKETNNHYCQLLLTKSLFKICDEYASKDDTSDIKEKYKEDFTSVINSLFFFKQSLTPLAEDIISNRLQPNKTQKEVLDSHNLADCIILKQNTGGGKTVAAELIKFKKNKNFISYHTPTRFLALEQSSRIFDSIDLLEARKIRYIPEMSIYHHTIDQIYLALIGFKREYLLLKLFFNGIVVFDEIDLFQDRQLFFNISFMLNILSELKIPVVITTATSTTTLEKLIYENYNGTKEFFPKQKLENSKIKAKINLIKNENLSDDFYIKICDTLIKKQNEGEKVGVFFNNTSSCVLIANELKKRDIDFVLYHSRLSKKIKERNKEKLLKNFNKQAIKQDKYPIAIMSPLAEVGVDISFSTMITDPAPIRNIEQRVGRLNRWGLEKSAQLFILDDFVCGFGSKKNANEQISKLINNQEVFSNDPYFADKRLPFKHHTKTYEELENEFLGFEQCFVNDEISNRYNEYKNIWFRGILNNERVGILNNFNADIPNYKKDYSYSLSILPFIFIKRTSEENFLNMCFRQVDAKEFITEEREYSSIPNYFFNGSQLKSDYIEDEEFGIIKSWTLF